MDLPRSSYREETPASNIGWFIMIGTLAAGSLDNIAFKEQDDFIENSETGQRWNHPFLQVFLMFFAEFLCYIAYQGVTRFTHKLVESDDSTMTSPEIRRAHRKIYLLALIPATFDFIGSTLEFTALNLISQSIYMMFRGGVPVVTAMLSILVLRKKLTFNEFSGIGLAVFGIGMVGFSQYTHSQGQDNPAHHVSKAIIGMICVIGSLVTSATQMILEEKFLNKFRLPALKMVGLEGLWGIILSTISIAVAASIPCTYEVNGSNCNANGFVEDPIGGIRSALNSWTMITYVVLGVCSLGVFNLCCTTVTKFASALSTSLMIISITTMIWVYDLLFHDQPFYWMQFAGFSLLVLGNLIYQKIITFHGLTKKGIEELELIKSQDVLPTLHGNL
jgi:drug/metabolite transporter (DMT)-like permease